MAALTEAQRKFLEENPFVGTVTTLRGDGSPHSTIVWVDVAGARSTRLAPRRRSEQHVQVGRDQRTRAVDRRRR